jgi:chaperone protein DnaK
MTASQEVIIGIDLGTTNSLVALGHESGPEIIRRTPEGGSDSGVVPSFAAFDPATGRITVGAPARAHAVENPTTTVFSIKRLMGKGFADLEDELRFLPYRVVRRRTDQGGRDVAAVEIEGRQFTPPEISAMILRELKSRAEAYLGHPVCKAVVTTPAYFDDAQRQATRDAGRIAGLDVLRIVNEPTAAALAYGLDRNENATLAVYDLGGGTFDVSILALRDGVFEVLSTHGDTHLGGDDFDRCIIELVQSEIAEQFGVTIDSPAIKQLLRTFAENVKIELSEHQASPIQIDLGHGRRYDRMLSRREFEDMIEPLVQRTIDSVHHALADAGISPDGIDQVVMVGGSTRVPLVRRRVAEALGREPYTALNPEEVVALGAAVQASILAGIEREVLLLDVMPLSLGIETMGGAMGKLIMRNTRIPAQATEMFTTFVDGQTNIKINVLQGERELASDCRSLGQFELRGIPPMPAGLPKVQVTFLIDQNGILNVTARELRSGKEAGVQILPSHGLTTDEVRRMEEESYTFARQDMTAHRLIDLRNQVTFDTRKAEQALASVGNLLDEQTRREIEQAIVELRRLAAESDDADRIYRELDRFGKMTVPLAETAITAGLKESTT